ncbi:MAG: MFS transporter [Gemmatimonadota bacterium]
MAFRSHGRNYWAFLWHAAFLALTMTFTDINTVLPSLVMRAGGSGAQLGLLTAIMVGTPLVGQLLFASYLHLKRRKKPFLIFGITLRVLALGGVALVLLREDALSGGTLLALVFLLMFLFSLSGAFAGVSYTDVLGKSLAKEERKSFFVTRQVLRSLGILVSALAVRQILAYMGYPENYARLFLLASGLLLTASLGFWVLREPPAPAPGTVSSVREVLASIPRVLRENPRLRHWVLVVNLTGFGLTLMPFYVAMARDSFGLSPARVGNFLFVQILGMLLSSWIWSRVVKRHGFSGVVLGCVAGGAALPLLALVLARTSLPIFMPVFFIMGMNISARKIGFDGLFIEITTDENRALHQGILGALSITGAAFPLVAGWLIDRVGFAPVFVAGSVLIATAAFFVRSACRGPTPSVMNNSS